MRIQRYRYDIVHILANLRITRHANVSLLSLCTLITTLGAK